MILVQSTGQSFIEYYRDKEEKSEEKVLKPCRENVYTLYSGGYIKFRWSAKVF